MGKIINQNSFVIFGGILLIALGYFLFRNGFKIPQAAIFFVALAVLAMAWLALRPKQSPVTTATEVEQIIGSGTPVLLEFQSPF